MIKYGDWELTQILLKPSTCVSPRYIGDKYHSGRMVLASTWSDNIPATVSSTHRPDDQDIPCRLGDSYISCYSNLASCLCVCSSSDSGSGSDFLLGLELEPRFRHQRMPHVGLLQLVLAQVFRLLHATTYFRYRYSKLSIRATCWRAVSRRSSRDISTCSPEDMNQIAYSSNAKLVFAANLFLNSLQPTFYRWSRLEEIEKLLQAPLKGCQ